MVKLEFQFNKQVIEFDVSGADVMINATEMGKIFGKRPIDFLKQEGTKAFIEELKGAIPAFRSDSASLLNAGNEVLTDENIVRSDRGRALDGGSTWMHRQLALKFAAWLDPKFEVWVYQTIDTLLFDHARRTTEELKEKAKLSDRRAELIQELQGNQKFQEYMEIEFKIRQANNRIIKSNNSQLGLFRNLQD